MKVSCIFLSLLLLGQNIFSIHIFKLVEDKLTERLKLSTPSIFPFSLVFPDARTFVTHRQSRSIVSNIKDLLLNNPISQAINSLLPDRSANGRGISGNPSTRGHDNYIQENFPDYRGVYEFSPEYIQNFQPSQNLNFQYQDYNYDNLLEDGGFYEQQAYNQPQYSSETVVNDIDTYGSPAAPIIQDIETYGAPAAPVISDQHSDLETYGAPAAPVISDQHSDLESYGSPAAPALSDVVSDIETYGSPAAPPINQITPQTETYGSPLGSYEYTDSESYGSPEAPALYEIVQDSESYGSPIAPAINEAVTETETYGSPVADIITEIDYSEPVVNEQDTYGNPSGDSITGNLNQNSGSISFPVSESIGVYDPYTQQNPDEGVEYNSIEYTGDASNTEETTSSQDYQYNSVENQVQIIKDFVWESIGASGADKQSLTQNVNFPEDGTEGPYTFKSIDDILKNPIFREQAHLIMNTNYENHPLVEFI